MEKGNDEVEFDLMELLRYLKKKVLIIVCAFVACALLGFAFSRFFLTPMYTASTRAYVLNRSNDNAVMYSDLQLSSQLLNDYKVLITGQNVTKEVITELGLDMTPEQLSAQISVTAPNDTRVLQISVTNANPQRAADIANAIQKVATLQIKEIMDVDAVNVIYEADVPDKPSSPNVKRNTVLAAMLGLIASVGVLTIIFLCDDTIRTEEDVEHYLGLSTLGVIPASANLSDTRSHRPNKHNGTSNR